MCEIGIDISGGRSKDIAEFLPPNGRVPDLIIGVCSSAADNCPVFPGTVRQWHWRFDDPAHATGTDEQIRKEFVRIRDEIHCRLVAEFGLAAGVFTNDVNKATSMASQLNGGQVYVNSWFTGSIASPFGGYKKSGYSREKGQQALKSYLQVKNVGISLS